MKKKVFSLMMTLLFAFLGVAKAEVVTIGDGTSTYYYYPVNMFYNYSLTQEIYTADEIGTAGTINAISFYYDYSGSFSMNNITLYMKNVTREAFASNTDMEPLALGDIVWTGTFAASNAGWVTITLDTPFEYDGTSNLLVAAFDGTNGYPGSSYKFRTTTCTGYKGIHWYSDSYTPDPYNTASGFSGSKSYTQYRANIQLDITPGGGGGADQLHVKYMDGDEVVVDALNLGVRPAGAWMAPFDFTMYTDGTTYTVNILDFTPSDDMFSVSGENLPFHVVRNEDVDLMLSTNATEAGTIERQFVAITAGDRAAHIWPLTVEFYAPEIPDVWELACEEATTFPFVEVPANAHHTVLHNDYTLPFPEIPEGVDAVYKLVFDHDQILNAEVTAGANGKVALYNEDFNGEGGPMANNNYTSISMNGPAATYPYEVQLGEGTTTSGYLPFYCFYNYSISQQLYLATELAEAGVSGAPMTSISWYCTATNNNPQNNITIWIANVEQTAVTSPSPLTSTMTKVYEGSCTPAVGWNEFVFNQGNFAWDGHSNILVCVQRNNGAWASGVSWQVGTQSFTASAYNYTDSGSGYDMTTQTYTMSTTTSRANVILKGGNREGGNRDVTVDFEDHQIPAGWTNDATYPWTVVSENGSLVMKSGNSGVSSSTSAIEATYTLTTDGEISFDLLSNGEGSDSYDWDNSRFYIDGVQQFRYGAHTAWENFTASVSAGIHTFKWEYKKDGSVNPTGDCFMVDNITITGMGDPLPEPELDYSFGPVIENLPLRGGTYYLVASSTDPDFEVTINAEDMPCPDVEGFAFNPTPADDADGIQPGSVTLRWSIPTNATGWRLVFGTTYYPEQGHPQTILFPSDGSFTTNLATSYTVHNLWNNTNYFWHVEFNNDGCPNGVSSPIWGFTTHLNIPSNLTADDYTVFNDEHVTLHWNAVVDRTYRQYFIYRDGVKVGETTVNQIDQTSFTDGLLAYNMDGYTYYVTAVYDEGESAPSDPVTVRVSGYGDVNGHVYEQDGETGIANATVTMVGQDEFGVSHTYNFTTNNEGYYTGHIYAGSYNGAATCTGYQPINAPVQGNPIAIAYNNTTTPIDYILDENFYTPCTVIAQYYPDSTDVNAPYVKVYWGCGLPGEEIVEPFETGDFSQFDWQLDPTYPWSITTTNPYEGTYCMKSGGAGVANVVSNMSVTVEIPSDGDMSFFGKISCESSWDYGYFYIDGVQKGSFTGQGNWVEKTYEITAGTHTFKWSYTKDGSVNSYDDCFYVDYITFYRRPEPAIPGMTYDFENGTMQGWTSVDADGDGYGWLMGSEVMTGQPGNGGSTDFVLSQSYYMGTVLYPDNYLVSPQVQLGGIVRFYACAQDASYAAEHFGLAVSTTNTNPSSFTMVQEWTMTAKGGELNGKPAKGSRSGREQGNWYEYTVDLSAYSGMGYVAIRHFNCSDMFYLNVDDITIGEPGKGLPAPDRAFSHYRVYRTNCYNDGPYTEDNTVVLACELHDTLYIDVSWPDAAPGVYKWGVGCVYNGNRGEEVESEISWSEPIGITPDKASRETVTIGEGTSTTYVTPFNSLWGYSFVEQIYTAAEIGTAGTINSISFNLRETDASQTNQIDVFMKNVSRETFSSNTDFETVAASDMVFSGTVTFNAGWTTITLDSPFVYDGTSNLMIGIHEYTAGYSTRYFYYTSAANRVLSYHSDSANPDPYNLGAYSGNKYTSANRANIQIEISGGGGSGSGSGENPYGPGTNPIQEPRESEIVWSNCLDKDMYLDNVTVNVLLNSADSPEGTTVDFTNLNDVEQQNYPIEQLVLDESGFYAFETFRRGEYAINIRHEGYEPIDDTVSIWENTDLRYVMIEILYGVSNVYVSRTGWAMWDEANIPGGGGGGGQGGNASTFSVNFDDGQMPAGWTTIDANNDGYNWVLGSQIGGIYLVSGASLAGSGHNSSADLICSGSYSNASGQAITPDNYLVSPQVTLAAGSTFSFWACAQDASYAAEHFGVFISDNGTSNWTAVQEWTMTAKNGGDVMSIGRGGETRAQGTWRQYTVDLSSFAGQKYIAIRHFNCNDQFILDVDDIELTAGAKSDERHLEYYKVLCTSIDGVPIFNHNTVHPFCQLSTNEPYNAPLVEGEHYLCQVACMYSTGMSAWSEAVEWEYEPCDHWGPVDEVSVESSAQGNHIEWVFEHGYNPYGGDTPGPGPGGAGDSFSVNFDDGQIPAGWTTIDANNDGYNWVLGSQVGGIYLVSGASLEGSGHNSSTDLICSGSYSNASGQAITPDNYLVSPQVNLAAGSTFSFWACAQDASYAAEHFGVFISDNGTSGWTSVQEWTMTAKSGGVMSIGRGGQTRAQGTWRQYTVDLSAFAGQKYIAIRHFNCNDQFILDVDDIELTAGTKGGLNFAKGGEFYNQYAEDGLMLNFFALDNVDLRTYLLYVLSNDSRFTLVPEEDYGQFILTSNNANNFMNEFETVYQNAVADFSLMNKVEIAERIVSWKSSVPSFNLTSIMMDVLLGNARVDNDHCVNSLPFCTSETITFEAANTSNTANEPGMDDGCIGYSYNPSFYHMRIHTGGAFVIHMEGHDPTSGTDRDIDFCMWGPYTEQEVISGTACSNLTGDKIMDCCYSASYSENCYLGYPEGQHQHNTSHGSINYHMPEVGEYYILMITNYSQQPCEISFTKTEGEGETDCEIVTPTDLIGFLITEDGEYVAFAGPDDREYTVEGEFGDHEYCVRPIYPGQMVLPDHNYGWSMGCPVCEFGPTGATCSAYAPIHGEAINATDQVKIWWGEENPGPGPGGCEGDEFTVDFESGMPAGWTTMDVDGDGYNWVLGSNVGGIYLVEGASLAGSGHNSSNDLICSGSYSNVVGPLTPDNWLISPEVTLCEGSTFSFWACGQDASYVAEHFGVAVSEDGSTYAMVQEWTMTAKDGGVMSIGRDGNTRAQGSWHQYTVDLGAYAGEGRRIAIRHFNCTDMFILDVDDIQLTNGAKNRANIVNFKVYRSTDNVDYTLLNTVAYVPGQTYYEYIDTPAGAGTYYYQVVTVYDNGCESDPAAAYDNPNNDYVEVGVTGIGENNGKVALYPNPTKGNVTIEANGMSRITVVSMLGQVVFDTELNADVYTLNMAQFNAGMYMVRVYTEEGVTVKRVTVMQ